MVGFRDSTYHWFYEEDVMPGGVGGRRGQGEWGRAGHSRTLSQDRNKNEKMVIEPI